MPMANHTGSFFSTVYHFKARNTLEHAQVCTAFHRTKLPWCASVDSTNNLRHTLQICSCAVQTLFDCCQSIKVGIILCVLGVDSFLAFLLPRWRTVFYVTLNEILLSFMYIGWATHVPHAHTFAVISRFTPHRTIWCGSNLCLLKCIPSSRFVTRTHLSHLESVHISSQLILR